MLQLSYAEVDFGGQDLVSLLSWASDSDELDGLRMGSGWAPDVPKNVLSFCHVSDQATSVFGFPTAKLGEGETREISPYHDVPIPQWLRLQLVLQRSSAASQNPIHGTRTTRTARIHGKNQNRQAIQPQLEIICICIIMYHSI